jgi:hypothetical protein
LSLNFNDNICYFTCFISLKMFNDNNYTHPNSCVENGCTFLWFTAALYANPGSLFEYGPLASSSLANAVQNFEQSASSHNFDFFFGLLWLVVWKHFSIELADFLVPASVLQWPILIMHLYTIQKRRNSSKMIIFMRRHKCIDIVFELQW